MEIGSGNKQEADADGGLEETKQFLGCIEDKETGKLLEFILPYIPSDIEKRSQCENETLPMTLTPAKPDGTKPERTGWKRYIGIILTLCSCVAFTLTIVIVKYRSQKINPASFGIYRFLGVMLSLPVLLYYRFIQKANVFQSVWPLNLKHTKNIKTALVLLLRGLTGSSAILLQYYAIGYISIASSTIIAFSSPIFVGFFAWLILGEKCGVIPVIAAFVTFAGVVVTVGFVPGKSGEVSTDNDHYLIGGGFSLASMFFVSSVYIILRYLRRVHFTLVTTSFGIIGLIQSAVICGVVGRLDVPDSAWEWFLVSSVGILTFVSQTVMTFALKFEDAGPVALVRSTDIVFAFVWQYVFLGVDPDVFSILGALIVCVGVGITGFRKYLSTLPPEHSRRKMWAFMLK